VLRDREFGGAGAELEQEPALAPFGLISVETRTFRSRTARGTLLGAHPVQFGERELHRLFVAEVASGLDALDDVEAEIGAQGFLDDLRVAPVASGSAHARGA
jgi:hypothetical protein